MTAEVIKLRPPVLRRATEAGCAGWTPIIRPTAETPVEPAPVMVRSADEPATPESVDEVNPLPATDPLRR